MRLEHCPQSEHGGNNVRSHEHHKRGSRRDQKWNRAREWRAAHVAQGTPIVAILAAESQNKQQVKQNDDKKPKCIPRCGQLQLDHKPAHEVAGDGGAGECRKIGTRSRRQRFVERLERTLHYRSAEIAAASKDDGESDVVRRPRAGNY